MERFRHQIGILSSRLRWSLSDPELIVAYGRAGLTTAEDATLMAKALHVLPTF